MSIHPTTRGFLIVSCFLFSIALLRAAIPDHPHPRLLFPKSSETAVQTAIANDPVAGKLHQEITSRARKILKERTCRYEIPDGRRLLAESRRALLNTLHCAMTWRLGGNNEFRQRVIAEMDAACAMKDWNPSHFLDTAEMAAAVAIGYDWLFHTLSPEQKDRYETALVELALKPAKNVHDHKGWWTKTFNNWSQVCGAGIGIAAAAVWEREPALCESLFRSSVELVESCGVFYQPDGCYPEGPGYWHYGTNYQVLLLATCESLGETIEVEPTLHRSGEFILQVVGPTGYDFNFADSNAHKRVPGTAQSWIAKHFNDDNQAHMIRKGILANSAACAKGGISSLQLLWLPAPPSEHLSGFPASVKFDGEQPLAFMRTNWSKDAAWLAIKGGTGAASHGHLDAGSFVYEASGQRWMVDLGSDNYNMPGYFGGKRWNYYRLTNRSHNTLVIDDRLQDATPTPCPIAASGTNAHEQWLSIDLSPAYPQQADSVFRKATFDTRSGETRIHDTIANPAGTVRWAVLTDASTRIDGPRVILEKEGKQLVIHREDQSGGSWQITDATPPTEMENQNRGYRIISFTAPRAEHLDLIVRWAPQSPLH